MGNWGLKKEKRLLSYFLIFITLFCLMGCQSQKKPVEEQPLQVQVKVARVVSGQTLEVLGMGDQPNLISQVRLIGIDAPDIRQRPWGDGARETLDKLIGSEQQSVRLEFDLQPKDKIGRNLAYVWKDEVLLNEQLVKDGLALFAPRSPNNKYDLRLERAQQWSRLMGQGIWNPDKPMRVSPAEFRRQNR
ncbi:MAG: thermonuclease family protein [Scytonematopsis contorta HA4267-MV1]|nr:thermonuclease family protein [Scytonematopsis contorta HA4267-MV1]